MAVPEEYIGIWSRVSIALDDAAPSETQSVTWIQSGELYCDLRVPLDQLSGADPAACMSFAGDCISLPPRLRWTHCQELEREPGPDSLAGVDEGEVWWSVAGEIGSDLIEQGQFDGPLGPDGVAVPIVYTEVWHRVDPGPGDVLALAAVDGTSRLVVVGSHALVVSDGRTADAATAGEYLARYQYLGDDGLWVTVSSIGDVSGLPDPPVFGPQPAGDLAVGSEPEWAGRTWTVIETRAIPALADLAPSDLAPSDRAREEAAP